METEKKKRGRPPKRKVMEFEGMTYEGAINHALDQEVRADLDKSLADKDESQLTDDLRRNISSRRMLPLSTLMKKPTNISLSISRLIMLTAKHPSGASLRRCQSS